MMKRKQVVGSVLSAAVASVAVGWAQQARAVIRFNEVHVDASGTNNTQDFIELRSTTGGAEAFADLSVLMLEGDSGAVGGTGVVDTVLPFSGTTGSNGLYLRHSLSPLTQAPPFDPATVVLESGYAHENAAITYVLVSGFTGSQGQDLDTNDDGALDATPWTAVLDAFGAGDASAAADRLYGAALGGADFTDTVLGPAPVTGAVVRAVFRTPDGTVHGARIAASSGGNYLINTSGTLATGYALSPGNANNAANLPSKAWIGTSGADWAVTTNWADGIVPAAAGDIAMFDGSSGATINLAANTTAGALVFNGSAKTIAAGGGTLTLDSAGDPNVQVSWGNHVVAAPVDLPKTTFANIARGQTLTFSGAVSGAGGISKNNIGTLVLSGTNTYTGGTTVTEGVLSVSDNANLGAITSPLTFNGGTFRVTGTTFANLGARPANWETFAGTIDVADATHTFTAGSGVTTTVTLGLTKVGTGTAVVDFVRGNVVTTPTPTNTLTVNNGRLRIAPNGTATGVSKVNLMAVGANGRLDLTNNKLITASPLGDWNGLNYTDVAGLVDRGRGDASNALWDGTGIITSDTRAVNNNDLVSIGTGKVGTLKGIADTASTTFAGQTVLGSDTIVMTTWGGDANLDGKINIDDYGQIDFNVASSGAVFGWYNGDFNYDGKINIDDYGIIDFNVSAQDSIFPTGGDGIEGVAAVPEPAGAALLAIASLVGLRRSRRRTS